MKKSNIKTYLIAALLFVAGFGLASFLIRGGESAPGTESGEHTIWTCSMDPQVRQHEPGDCPICGMDLVPASSLAGTRTGVLEMTEDALRLADVQTQKVSTANAEKLLRLDGWVKADEGRMVSQTAHFPGRVEKLNIRFEGEEMQKGQVIAEIYSPGLVQAQEELLQALEMKDDDLIAAARGKLERWKIPAATIDGIESSRKAIRDLELRSDVSGVILSKKINFGDHLEEGQVLFDVADLSRIWVEFEVHESDLSWLSLNDDIQFSIPSYPQESFSGRVTFIDPVVDREKAITIVRTEVRNAAGLLKPGMYVNGQVSLSARAKEDGLMVPRSAVMWTGKKSVVYVKVPGTDIPSFEMREVQLGQQSGSRYLIKKGLRENEEIVVNGTFTVDAAAQLANLPSMMNRNVQVQNSASATESPPQSTSNRLEIHEAFRKDFQTLLEEYFSMKDFLVASDPNAAGMSAGRMVMQLNSFSDEGLEGETAAIWKNTEADISRSINIISGTKDLKMQRKYFLPLSEAMDAGVHAFGTGDSPVYVQFCPMANDDKGAAWLSRDFEIRNPYFGDQMLKCGNIQEEIPVDKQ